MKKKEKKSRFKFFVFVLIVIPLCLTVAQRKEEEKNAGYVQNSININIEKISKNKMDMIQHLLLIKIKYIRNINRMKIVHGKIIVIGEEQ